MNQPSSLLRRLGGAALALLLFGTGLLAGFLWPRTDTQSTHVLALPPSYEEVADLQVPFADRCFDAWTVQGDHAYLADAQNKQIDEINLQSLQVERPLAKGAFTGEAGCAHMDFAHMGPSAVAFDQSHRLWTSDGISDMKVLDVTHDLVISTLTTGGQSRVDGLVFDPVHQAMLALNSEEGFVSLIDGRSLRVLTRYHFASTDSLDEAVWDNTTQAFLITTNGPQGPGITALSVSPSRLLRVSHFWPLPATCGQGNGLAMNQQIVAVGCATGEGWLLNLKSGQTVQAHLTRASKLIDLVSSDPSTGTIAFATMSAPGMAAHIEIVNAQGQLLQTIIAAPMSHSVIFANHLLLIPEMGEGIVVYRAE